MESAKNTKLSLDAPDEETGFQRLTAHPTVQLAEQAPSEEKKEEQEQEQAQKPFNFSEPFWQAVESNPNFQECFARRVEEGVRQRLERDYDSALKKMQETAKEQGYRDGHDKGYAEGLANADVVLGESSKVLQEICEAITREKQTILKNHEALWLRGLAHLLKQFVVKSSKLEWEAVEQWVDSVVDAYHLREGVQVFVAESDYSRFRDSLSERAVGWEMKVDPKLKPGEIECSSEEGSVFFSRNEALEKLESLLGVKLSDTELPK